MTIKEAFESLEKESFGQRLRCIAGELDMLISILHSGDLQDGINKAEWTLEDVLSVIEIHDAIETSVKHGLSQPIKEAA